MSQIIIVVTEAGQAAPLSEFLGLERQETRALVVGAREAAEDAARVAAVTHWINTAGSPADNFAQAAAEVLASHEADIVVGVATPGVRAALGLAAAKADAAMVSNVVSCCLEGGAVSAERTVVDDKVVEELTLSTPAFLLVNPLAIQLETAPADAVQSPIEELSAEGSGVLELLGVEPVQTSSVETAEVVVGIGRGIGGADNFAAARELADALGAEMSGSLPAIRDYDYLPGERYIGISGMHISPRLYVALGVAGTAQHLAGVRNAQAIVVANKDPKAKFFSNADYGIVGDVADVIPALVRAARA